MKKDILVGSYDKKNLDFFFFLIIGKYHTQRPNNNNNNNNNSRPTRTTFVLFLVVYHQGQDLLDSSTYRTLPIQQREQPITTRKEA
jgi:hypothetical protein